MADNPIVIDSDSRESSPLSDASTVLSPPPGAARTLPIIENGQTKPKKSKPDGSAGGSSSKPKPAIKKDRPIKPKPTGDGIASSSKLNASGSPAPSKTKVEKQVKKAPKPPAKPAEPAVPTPPYFKKPEELEAYNDEQAITEDWQVVYVWAFLERFQYNIIGLYCMDDLETALQATDANEGLVNLFWDFLQDLLPQVDLSLKTKPTKGGSKSKGDIGKAPAVKEYGRPKDAVLEQDREKTVSERVRNLITARLEEEPATIWDPYTYQSHQTGVSNLDGKVEKLPFEVEEEEKKLDVAERTPEQLAMLEGLQGSYYTDKDQDGRYGRVQSAVGRNPMVGSNQREVNLWELKWQQRIKILRQMIDWILVENPRVKEYINDLYPKQRKRPTTCAISVQAVVEKDSNNKRIWSIDGNPHKMESPMTMIAHDRAGFEAIAEQYTSRSREIPQLTAIWHQASAKKRNTAKLQLERVKNDISIGKFLQDKIEMIETKLAALPEARARHQEEKAKRLKIMMQKENARVQKETDKLAIQYGGRRETRSGAKGKNYDERIDITDDEEEEGPTIKYNPRKRRGSPEVDEQYHDTGSESSAKRPKLQRAGLRSAAGTEDSVSISGGNDEASSVDGSEGDAISEEAEDEILSVADPELEAEDAKVEETYNAAPALTLPSSPRIKLNFRRKAVIVSDDEDDGTMASGPNNKGDAGGDDMDIGE